MIALLEFEFFRNAILAGILASIACGIIGTYVVVKRLSFLGGGISHAAFGGIGLGYFLGVSPVLGATVFSLAAAGFISYLRRRAHQYMDTLIAAMWAVGMAVGILFIRWTPGYAPDLFSYLFGNILLVPSTDLMMMIALDTVIVLTVWLLYNELLAVTFDEEFATIQNVPVARVNAILLSLIALSVVMLIRVVGIILVIALLTIPAAVSRILTTRLYTMMVLSVILGCLFTLGGIALSYYLDAPSGATIILLSAVTYGIVLARSGRIRSEAM